MFHEKLEVTHGRAAQKAHQRANTHVAAIELARAIEACSPPTTQESSRAPIRSICTGLEVDVKTHIDTPSVPVGVVGGNDSEWL